MKITKDLAFYLFCLCVIAAMFWPNAAKGQSGTIEMPKTVFGSCFGSPDSLLPSVSTATVPLRMRLGMSNPIETTKDTVTIRIACPEFINVLTWEPQKNNPEKWIEILQIKYSRMERTFEMKTVQIPSKILHINDAWISDGVARWETKPVQIASRYIDDTEGCYYLQPLQPIKDSDQ